MWIFQSIIVDSPTGYVPDLLRKVHVSLVSNLGMKVYVWIWVYIRRCIHPNLTIVSYAMDLFVLILICTPLRQYVVVTNIPMSIHVCTPLRQHVVVMCYILVSIHQYSYESNVYTVFVINGI